MPEAADSEIRSLNADVKTLRADLGKLTDAVTDLAMKRSSDAWAAGRQFATDVGHELHDQSRTVTDAIEEQPLAASMIAFSVGVLLGAIFTGRRA